MKIRNIYTFLLLSLFLSPAFGVRSQTKVEHLEDHKPLMNKIWETIDQLMYKVSTKNGISPMVEVTMEGTTKIAFESTPISLQGIIYLNEKDETKAEVQLHKAIKIAENKKNRLWLP